MEKRFKFLLILILFSLLIGAVSAQESNVTDNLEVDSDIEIVNENEVNKTSPDILIDNDEIVTGDSVGISLVDSNNTPIANAKLNANVNKKDYSLVTDDKGTDSLKLDLPAKSYLLNVVFLGDDNYLPVNKTFNIKVLKSDVNITAVNNLVIKNKYFSVYLKDAKGNVIEGRKLTFSIDGTDYTYSTNENGKASVKLKLSPDAYSMTIVFAGDNYYNALTKTIKVYVQQTTSLVIGNTRLLTNGYLRIYLKSPDASVIANKVIRITINGKTYEKKTTSEGFIVFKPDAGTGSLNVEVTYEGTKTIAGSSAEKTVKGIEGNVKNPLNSKIPLKNGLPDVDYMPKNYVMADEDATYTLTKDQYRTVIKRDSYCLYLNKKLSKFTFFKSKAEPKYNHIIKREKWNVIERAINTKIVLKNKHNYWPKSIKVNLKGKSYNYPEVRDVQNTGYTCGPTSSSMCSQVLRNYYNEKYLASKSGTSSYYGSSTSGLKKGLEKNHFKCSIYYKSSFNKALKQLKKGGCALVFHTWGHYVAILDISKDGKKVLVGNPSGDYDYGSHDIPTNWLTVKYMKKRFNNYDTSGLIVKLSYSLSKATKKKVNNFYSSMGVKWNRAKTSERIPNIG